MDKRIIKTKMNIKNTLIKLLQNQTFEKITVTQICNAGIIGRITFYTYYDDKYVLVDEIFKDFIDESNVDYHILQKQNNEELSTEKSYYNLLSCILNLYNNHIDFLQYANSGMNPYLYSAMYQYLFSSINKYIETHNINFHSKYPSRIVASLICNGLCSVINECQAENYTLEQTRELTESIFTDVLNSSIFTT